MDPTNPIRRQIIDGEVVPVNPEYRLALVEFTVDMIPSTVITMNKYGFISVWDFNYCKRDDCIYYSATGVGGKTYHIYKYANGEKPRYWTAGEVEVVNADNGEQIDLPVEWQLLYWRDEWEHFDMPLPIMEEAVMYCSICDDYLPTQSDDVCDHIYWDEKTGWWEGEGCE